MIIFRGRIAGLMIDYSAGKDQDKQQQGNKKRPARLKKKSQVSYREKGGRGDGDQSLCLSCREFNRVLAALSKAINIGDQLTDSFPDVGAVILKGNTVTETRCLSIHKRTHYLTTAY